MHQLRRRGHATYEDLLREMEAIEHQLLAENGALAMTLMVVEAKLRDQFQKMERQMPEKPIFLDETLINEEMTLDEVQALIPRDFPELPTVNEAETRRRRKQTIETVGMAAALALATALGVFGLASILQLALAWVA